MGDYTKLTISEISEIFGLYFAEDILSFKPLSLGISNSNYKISTNTNDYLLKVSNDKNAQQVLDEMKILDFLHSKKYPHSLIPIKTMANNLVYEINKYYGVMFPFIEGITPGPSDFTCYEIGKSLAQLHLIKGDFTNLRKADELSYPASTIKEYTKSKTCPDDFKNIFKELLGQRIGKYLEIDFPTGITHGDLYYDNTLFSMNELVAVLDFEQSAIGQFILDIGISISGCCLEKGMISLPLINSYMEGYESVRTLDKNEIEFLTDAVILGLFSIALWRIKRFKEGNLNPLMVDSYKQLLYRAQTFKQMVNQNES